MKSQFLPYPSGWRVVAVVSAASVLAACSSTQPTAFQLMQEQQQLHAQARQNENEEMRKSIPTQPEVLLELVRESQSQGRHFAALAYVDAYVQKMGLTPEVVPLRANALRMTGQLTASEAAYRSLLSTSRASEGWHGLGLIAGSNGDFSTASDYLARGALLSPTDADLLSDLGYARLRAGDLAGARIPLGQAAELNPASIKVIANLALLLLVDGQTERAHQVMTQGGMSDSARAQLQQLAAQTRSAQHSSYAATPPRTGDAVGTAVPSAEPTVREVVVAELAVAEPAVPVPATPEPAVPVPATQALAVATVAEEASSKPSIPPAPASRPSSTVPDRASLARAVALMPTPSRTPAVRPVVVEPMSAQTVAVQATPVQATPAQATPVQTTPVQASSAPRVASRTLSPTPDMARNASRAAVLPTTMLSPLMEQLGNTPLVR